MQRTWDVFDTLIARRCIEPRRVFQIIEDITKIRDFLKIRKVAEQNILSRKKICTLDLIYDEFQRITQAPKIICDRLKKLECDVELTQSIPITENIRHVRSGDILISDMYLPEDLIRRMLRKAGLLVPVEMIITSNGKRSGRVWKQFAEQKISLFHIGDSESSDLVNPRRFNLDSSLDIRSRPNFVEQFLMQHDFNFAAYLREIRLRNPFSEEIKRLYWDCFTLNVGILILIVRHLDDLQKKHGFEYLGFCGRDTHYLQLLYEKFKYDAGEAPVPNDYLFYSRKMVKNSPNESIKYFQSKIKNRKALFLDLIGTGYRLHQLRGVLNYSLLICCHLSKKFSDTYHKPEEMPDKWISFINNPDAPNESKNAFYFVGYEERYIGAANEVFNRATHNSPIRLNLVQVDEKILPLVTFSQVNDTENFDVFEACLHEVLNSNIVWSNLRRKDILEYLLKIFNSWVAPHSFLMQQTLEDKMNLIVSKALKK